MALLIRNAPPKNGFRGLPRTKLNRIEASLARSLKTIYYNIIDEAVRRLTPLAKAQKEAYIPIAVDNAGKPYYNDIFATIEFHKGKAVLTAADFVSEQLRQPLDKRYVNAFITPVIQERTFKIVTTKITETISNTLKNTIEKGMQQGASVQQIINHFERLKTNYRTIARTEINTAANEASYKMATKELVDIGLLHKTRKSWVTANDEKVRRFPETVYDHFAAGLTYAEGNGIPIEEPFIVGGEPILYPADYNGSAGNIINCRCNPRYYYVD